MSAKEDIALRKKIAEALIKARKIVADHKSEYHGVYRASGGGGTTTSNTSTVVPPEVLAEYQKVVAQANQVAGAPLNQYQGNIVAGTTPQETSAYNTIDNLQSMTGPVTAEQIHGYESPYTQDVLQSAIAAQNNQDAQQQEQLKGNAISAGAWGGDRSGVAQGILGGQQAFANNATNAGILNQGYSQALQEANNQQQTVFNNTLAGAGAELSAGQQQQQQAQSILNVPYEQFLQQQAYPFQTTGWLGNIAEGIGSNEGGSSTSSTSQPSQGLFSDRRLKKNIEPAGILAGRHGHYPLHTYEYKGDDVRRTGVIAQEVEHTNPDAVGMRDGYRTVDYSKLARGGIVPHRAEGGPTIPNGMTALPQSLQQYYQMDGGYYGPAPVYGGNSPIYSQNGQIIGYHKIPQSAPPASGTTMAAPTAATDTGYHAAPTYAQFAPDNSNSQAGTPYTGGKISGITAGNQADLDAIYKKSRGGIVPHRGIGGMLPNILGTGIAPPLASDYLDKNDNSTTNDIAKVLGGLNIRKFLANGGTVPQHFDSGGADIMSDIYSAESGNDPDAISPAGAQGIAQIMPSTAHDPGYGVEPLHDWNGSDVRTAPEAEQKRFATDYHDAMLRRYGNEPEALMAYNAGPGRIDKLASGDIALNDLPQETRDYPRKVLGDATDYYQNDLDKSNGILPPTPPINATDHPSNYGYTAELPHTHEADPWLSVAAGVLGTLAGRSRNPLVDIGQGGLIGLNNYAQQVKTADEQNYTEGSFKNNAQKLMQEAKQHQENYANEQEKIGISQQQADTQERYRKDQAANMTAERQKPIPDGFGGFIIPNPTDPAHPTQVNLGGPGGDPSKQSIANIYNPPAGPDGQPLRGEEFLKTIPAPIASQARLYVKGDAPPPTGFAAKPLLLAAQQAAAVADPTWTGQRYSTIQDFTKGTQTAKTVQAQNVTMEHIGTLQEAINALDNGDVRQFNKLSQEIARQTGSPVPTNFELGKTIVYDEMAKAILGANSAVSDRQEFVKNMDVGSSRKQAEGQLAEAGKYMAGQAYGLETRYTAGSGLTNYRNRFMTPAARQLMEKYYPSVGGAPEAAIQPKAPQSQQPSTIIKYDASGNRIQ